MKEFKIRCHALSKIMAGEVGLTEIQLAKLSELKLRKFDPMAKALTANMEKELEGLSYKQENPQLPQGAKTYCKNWLKENLYNRKQDWKAIVVEKGLMCENDGVKLISDVFGIFPPLEKNDEYFENDYLEGTYDVSYREMISDVKNSWDLFTFPMFDDEMPNTDYWWQLQGYMVLTGYKKAAVQYVLIDTPMALVSLDLKKLYFQSGGKVEDWNPDAYESMYENYRFSDIPKEKRIKSFYIDYEPGIESKIKQRVLMCRKYIEELKTMKDETRILLGG